jgi:hypothetical protein
MRINNQTNDPVEWEQNGSPQPENFAMVQSQEGQLGAMQETPPIVPVGAAPWFVTFSSEKHDPVTSPKFSNPDATVTLNDDWTVTVT